MTANERKALMLKKGVTAVKFIRHESAMRQVLSAVEIGHMTKREVQEACGLEMGKVDAALRNLAFIGAVMRTNDSQGRSVYSAPGRVVGVAKCLCGVRSIFDVATTVQNQMSSTPERTDK